MTIPSRDERLIAMLSHLLALMPGVGIIGPAIIYLFRNRDSEYVTYHSRQSLNFQISMFMLSILCIILLASAGYFLIGIVLWMGGIICPIFGCFAAWNVRPFRYPLTINFI